MNEEKKKLESVVKSCKAASICSMVIFFCLACATTLLLIIGILMLAKPETFDEQLKAGDVNMELKLAGVTVATVGDEDETATQAWTSDVPALQEYLNKNAKSDAVGLGLYLLMMAVIAGLTAFCMWQVHTVFKVIVKEGNPFADQVPKKILTAMIILTVTLGLSSGVGFAVVLGLVTWAVYAIVDYGKYLRIQSDETL
ncbi:MAG: hypothetical protein K6G07_04505 [Lachnospiraceae bacterium]|nr:hypothetical protein [Lachnospiraceae bacterium]